MKYSTQSSVSTVVVTGASGLLGRHLCDHFRRRRWVVRGMVRDTSSYPFAEPGISRFRCSLPDEIDSEALVGADVLVHCAYMTRFTNMKEARRVNEEGTARLLKMSREAEVKRFVFISSNSARPDAPSYYARSKYLLEQTMDLSRDLVIRPGLILASQGGLFHRIAKSAQHSIFLPAFGGGNQIVQTVHIDDLCEAIDLALQKDLCGTIKVAEPSGLRMKELLQLIASSTGRPRIVVPLPIAPFIAILRLFEAFGARLPISSENLLGLSGLRRETPPKTPVYLEMKLRSTKESLLDLAETRTRSGA